MIMATTVMPTTANASPRRFGLGSSRVVPGNCAAGSAVVGPVFRAISGVVDVWGRRLVWISLDTGPEPTFAVAVSPPNEPESLISATPSVRQKASASSASTRLHWGQRFTDIYDGILFRQIHPFPKILVPRIVVKRVIRNLPSDNQ